MTTMVRLPSPQKMILSRPKKVVLTGMSGLGVSGLVVTAVLKRRDGRPTRTNTRHDPPSSPTAATTHEGRGFMPRREGRHEIDAYKGDVGQQVADQHLTEAILRRYVAAVLGGAGDDQNWTVETAHLASCGDCRDVAIIAAEQLGESPKWQALESGELEWRSQERWITRLREHPQAPMRRAAARELGTRKPVGGAVLSALLATIDSDPDGDVRAAAQDALDALVHRQPLRELV